MSNNEEAIAIKGVLTITNTKFKFTANGDNPLIFTWKRMEEC